MHTYKLWDTVKVIPLNIEGVVDAVMEDSTGQQLRVVYWYNGDRLVNWLYPHEIKHFKPK